jgi:hypothetical protein
MNDIFCLHLTNHSANELVFIDVEDAERVLKYSWCNCNGYIQNTAGGQILSRFILNLPKGEKLVVDHKNRNPKDNRKSNLRHCSQSLNQANAIKTLRKTTSQFKGVAFIKYYQKWRAYIKKDGRLYFIGNFSTEKEAALAYNKRAFELFGEFARLNNI